MKTLQGLFLLGMGCMSIEARQVTVSFTNTWGEAFKIRYVAFDGDSNHELWVEKKTATHPLEIFVPDDKQFDLAFGIVAMEHCAVQRHFWAGWQEIDATQRCTSLRITTGDAGQLSFVYEPTFLPILPRCAAGIVPKVPMRAIDQVSVSPILYVSSAETASPGGEDLCIIGSPVVLHTVMERRKIKKS